MISWSDGRPPSLRTTNRRHEPEGTGAPSIGPENRIVLGLLRMSRCLCAM